MALGQRPSQRGSDEKTSGSWWLAKKVVICERSSVYEAAARTAGKTSVPPGSRIKASP
ncbi:hypothetical protein D3C87_1922070 [compost metagenome]